MFANGSESKLVGGWEVYCLQRILLQTTDRRTKHLGTEKSICIGRLGAYNHSRPDHKVYSVTKAVFGTITVEASRPHENRTAETAVLDHLRTTIYGCAE